MRYLLAVVVFLAVLLLPGATLLLLGVQLPTEVSAAIWITLAILAARWVLRRP